MLKPVNRKKLKHWLRFFVHWFYEVPLDTFWIMLLVAPPFLYYYIRRKGLERKQLEKLRSQLRDTQERVRYNVSTEHGGFACSIVSVDNHPCFIFSDPNIMEEVDKLVRSSGVAYEYEEYTII